MAIYIEFSNGMKDPSGIKEDVIGEQGPTFGPYDAAHSHDGAIRGIGGVSEERGGSDLFHQVSGRFFYDGTYYADAWVFKAAPSDPKTHRKAKPSQYDKKLAEPPKPTGGRSEETTEEKIAPEESWSDILKSELHSARKSGCSADKYVCDVVEDVIHSSDDSPDLILAELDVLTECAAFMRMRLMRRLMGFGQKALDAGSIFSKSRLRLQEERYDRLRRFIDEFGLGGMLYSYMESRGEIRTAKKKRK